MEEIDLWLLVILSYNTISHLYLDAYEDRTVKTRWITMESVVILVLYCVMMIVVEYNT
jgi:hypothetical protein